MTACAIGRVRARAYVVPTASEESDGTHAWSSTTLVLVEAEADGCVGIGFSYCHASAARLVDDTLAGVVEGRDAMAVEDAWWAMLAQMRNLGREGIAACAISAVDLALWDLKAKLLDLPLVTLIGAVREGLAVYGSGGFTSEDDTQLSEQLAGWVEEGLFMAKIKIGRRPERDLHRVEVARHAVGPETQLFVDANGAFTAKQAMGFAEALAERDVRWFEEPVSSDDLEGLRRVRDRAPPPVAITAGEYGWDFFYFRRMLEAGAVDVLQADVTRCLGISGIVRVAHECEARNVPLSFHCCPSMHLHVGCALRPAVHAEWFFDHVRIERMLFDGFASPRDGILVPDRSRPGHGLTFKGQDARRFAA